jgi:fucose permease
MSKFRTIAAIAACYFIFAILLNSVGTVILQSINSFAVSKPEASVLEGFKDLSIALVSFLVAALIPRIGYKISLLIGLVLVTCACLVVPSIATFWAIKLLFASIGVAFALVKVSVYAIVGQLSDGTKSHSSLLNTIEGIFMLGVLSGYWLFSFYIDPNSPSSVSWLSVYYPLAAVLIVVILLVVSAPIKAPEIQNKETSVVKDFVEMLKLTYQPLVIIFVVSVFLYVLIEQGIGTWLPTFNNEILALPVDISVQITSVFAAAIAIGRLVSGQLLRFIDWYRFLIFCLLAMAGVMLLTLPLAEPSTEAVTSIFGAPTAAFLLPLVGAFMAPIYPVLNSVMLSALDRSRHAAMTGLIVVFSALGGTTGSILTGFVFDRIGGQNAFYLSLVPMALLLVCLWLFRLSTTRMHSSVQHRGEAA